MTVATTVKRLQTRCSPKSFSDLVAIVPSLASFAAYDVQVIIAAKLAPEDTSNKNRVIVSLYHGDHLPSKLQVTSPTMLHSEPQDPSFPSSLIVQVTFTGPATIDHRLQHGAASTQRYREGDRTQDKLSFEEQAQVVNRLYHWVARQVKEVPDMRLPWNPLSEELTPSELRFLKLEAKAANDAHKLGAAEATAWTFCISM